MLKYVTAVLNFLLGYCFPAKKADNYDKALNLLGKADFTSTKSSYDTYPDQ